MATNTSKPEVADRFEPVGERGLIKRFDFDPKRYVFISCPTETDKALLRAIVRCLLRRKVGVWIYKPGIIDLTDNELEGVRSQAQDEEARRGVGWPKIALDAMDAASSVLLLIGQDSQTHQKVEIDHAILTRSGDFHVVRIDDIADDDVPADLQRTTNYKLNPTKYKPNEIAGEVKQLTNRIARQVLGHGARTVRARSPLTTRFRDRRATIAAGLAITVAVVAMVAAAPLWNGASAPPPVVNKSAVPVEGKRLALVITQTNYNNRTISRVEKAEEEGTLIAGALDELGFDITLAPNNSKANLETALNQFRVKLKAAGTGAVAFIYYTGHGIQHPKQPDNYLLGTDAVLTSAADIETFGVSLATQLDLFHGVNARAIIMVFDACRNIPPDLKSVTGSAGPTGYVPQNKGLRVVKPVSGMLVAYATKEGDFAQEGIYAPILAEELLTPNQIVEQAFVNAKYRVASKSGNHQLPYNESEIYEGLCFSCSPAGR
jgi:Caspase domain